MIFRLPIVACVVLSASLCLAAAPAQAQSSDTSATARNDVLYRQLGGQAGLVKLMDDFMPRLLADRRLQPFFKDVNQEHLKEELVTQFCEVSGGPCKRRGPDMKRVHEGFDIDRASFNALVEVLQESMDAQGIPFSAQNKLLAQLAPMHRDIVNVK
jgi:hemoglobin